MKGIINIVQPIQEDASTLSRRISGGKRVNVPMKMQTKYMF